MLFWNVINCLEIEGLFFIVSVPRLKYLAATSMIVVRLDDLYGRED
jgi:hypothetical protein